MRVVLALLVIVLIAGCITQQLQPNQLQFANQIVTFRANLAAADAVPVLPNEQQLISLLLDPMLQTVAVAFVPNETENGFYAVTGFELSYKLTLVHRALWGTAPVITAIQLNASPNVSAIPTDTVIIWMRGPGAGANNTAVRVEGRLIYVDGADLSQIGRTWTDLDLAAGKLLLVLMRASI